MKTVKLESVTKEKILSSLKRESADSVLKKSVEKIIEEVKANGDKALVSFTKKFDDADISKKGLVVSAEEIEKAYKAVPKEFIKALKEAKKNIEVFHEKQTASSWLKTDKEQMIGQLVGPIERAGLYIPGGENGYPSTVLMTVIPAKTAGVDQIILISPPDKKGEISQYTLAAACECGIDEVYRVGGAQGIAALAYGTETIKAVDVIAGPGNAYVTEAKRKVFGDVGIDLTAGPSEVVILADIKSNPNIVAADLLSQAEHDSQAKAILVTTNNVLAKKVNELVYKQLEKIPRKRQAKKALDEKGLIISVGSKEEAIKAANIIAPEHLVIMLEQPTKWLPLIKNAGAIFLGATSVQSAADYSVGPNHVLPTGGSARFASPLSVETFQKKSNIVWLGEKALSKDSKSAVVIARTEGFEGHVKAIEERNK